MSKAEDTKQVELKEVPAEVLEMAERIRAKLAIKEGVPEVEDGIYIDCLPEGLTIDVVDTVRKHNEQFVAASAWAAGNRFIDHMKDDKECEKLAVTIPMSGRDKVTLQTKRHSVFPNPADRSKTVESWGATTAVLTQSLDNKNSGNFGIVVNNLKHLAAEALRDQS